MPNKTKKQKLWAEERKIFRLLHVKQEIQSPPPTVQTQKNQPVPTSPLPQVSPEEQDAISYFFSDLRKSLLFIAAIIALEFILYFASIKY